MDSNSPGSSKPKVNASLEAARDELLAIRANQGKRPASEKVNNLCTRMMQYLTEHGELFHMHGSAFYFDHTSLALHRIDGDSQAWAALLSDLGFMGLTQDAKDVTHHASVQAKRMEERTVARHAHAAADKSAIYIYASQSRMFKITAESIDLVCVGTDNVILSANDLADLPVDEILAELPRVAEIVSSAATKFLPDSPLAKLTTRFADTDFLTAEQQRQIAFTRLLFITVANLYLIYPILYAIGESGSGKSSLFEVFLSMLSGRPSRLGALPKNVKDLDADAVGSTFFQADNCDDVDFNKEADLANRLCQLATGYTIKQRTLYTNLEITSAEVITHVFATSRRPQLRDDNTRRALILQMKDQDIKRRAKGNVIGDVLKDRPAMLAEYLLRAQNILIAHQDHGDREWDTLAQMDEYEDFTYRCAAHDGNLGETIELWRGMLGQHTESNTESNAMVRAIRIFLGSPRAVATGAMDPKRGITTTRLHAEIKNLYEKLRLSFTYTNEDAFGPNMRKNAVPLKIFNIAKRKSGDERLKVFQPDEAELTRCIALYEDYRSVVADNPRMFESTPSRHPDANTTGPVDAETTAAAARARMEAEFDDLDHNQLPDRRMVN